MDNEKLEHSIYSFDLNYVCPNCKHINKDTVHFYMVFKKNELFNKVWQTTCGICYKKIYKAISLNINIENIEIIDVFNNANLLGDHH